MPTIKFYYMPESPPCRTVEMVAGLVGVTLDKHRINLMAKEHLSEENLKLNPLHTLPFIIDGDLKMNESRAIAAYLVNKYGPEDSALYPKDPAKRALVDELMFYDMGTLFHSISKVLFPMIRTSVKEPDAEAVKELKVKLAYLNDRLKKECKKFMVGDNLTIADVSVTVSLSATEAFGLDMSEYSALEAYLNRVKSAIPNYHEVSDEAVENMKKFIKSKAS